MIYVITSAIYTADPHFFLPGEVFEGFQDKNGVESTSETGESRETGWRIDEKNTKKLGPTWEMAKQNNPEYFL